MSNQRRIGLSLVLLLKEAYFIRTYATIVWLCMLVAHLTAFAGRYFPDSPAPLVLIAFVTAATFLSYVAAVKCAVLDCPWAETFFWRDKPIHPAVVTIAKLGALALFILLPMLLCPARDGTIVINLDQVIGGFHLLILVVGTSLFFSSPYPPIALHGVLCLCFVRLVSNRLQLDQRIAGNAFTIALAASTFGVLLLVVSIRRRPWAICGAIALSTLVAIFGYRLRHF
jgi:hypothetical protein